MVDAAVITVLSELDGFFTLKEKQRMTLKAFLLTGYGESLVQH